MDAIMGIRLLTLSGVQWKVEMLVARLCDEWIDKLRTSHAESTVRLPGDKLRQFTRRDVS